MKIENKIDAVYIHGINRKEDTRETKLQNMKNSNNKAVSLFLIVCLRIINAREIPTGQSKMNNLEKLADMLHTPMTNKTQTQPNLCLTPLSASKHK